MSNRQNCITVFADKEGRRHIEPVDVHLAFKENPPDVVRADLLEVFAKEAGYGVHGVAFWDDGIVECAKVAWAWSAAGDKNPWPKFVNEQTRPIGRGE